MPRSSRAGRLLWRGAVVASFLLLGGWVLGAPELSFSEYVGQGLTFARDLFGGAP